VRVGNGIDVHAFADGDDAGGPGRPLRLGGVHVPDAPGLLGHSDADVLVHAVGDALLGAAALGDLGSRFGVDQPELLDADSLGLLAEIVTAVASAGWVTGNLDVTVVAQRPRLAAYRDEIRANLARVLGVGVDAVSVKFTTTDRLGTIGRGEGIAAWATCLLLPRG
jgi:2-C-methyl-D-erythritol 2,4-cyclodiphosphate synthase